VRTFARFFLQFSYLLMFLNIQMDWIMLKIYDQQSTLTTKKSLHIIFKTSSASLISCAYKEDEQNID